MVRGLVATVDLLQHYTDAYTTHTYLAYVQIAHTLTYKYINTETNLHTCMHMCKSTCHGYMYAIHNYNVASEGNERHHAAQLSLDIHTYNTELELKTLKYSSTLI